MNGNPTGTPQPDGLDLSRPHAARVYDHCLGGKDHFAVDRAAAAAMIDAIPGLRHMARANRYFMHRVARHLAAKEGIRQFLDIGTGYPRTPNLHQIAQDIAPSARIVYVDNDPLVLSHARALLTSDHPDGRVVHVDADLRRPATILTDPALHATLDLNRPVGLTLIAILMLIADTDNPWAAVAHLCDALPSGSYLAITHLTADFNPHEVDAAAAAAARAGMTWAPRTLQEVERFFGDWELLDPGICPVSAWRPEEPVYDPKSAYYWAGMARKP